MSNGVVISPNLVSWKLVGDEAVEFKRRMVERQMLKHGLSREEAEEITDIWIDAVNETARESGEDV
jgi:hypothetical protein